MLKNEAQLRILHILSQTHLTGAEVYSREITDWLVDNGHEVRVISDKIHLPLKATYTAMPIDKARGLSRWRLIFRLRHFIIENKIEVIHTHSRASVRVAWWATRGLKVALVSTVHGNQHWSLSKRLFDLYGDRIICVCENVKNQLRDLYKVNARKLTVLRNPFTTPAPKMAPRSEVKRLALAGRTTGPKGKVVEFFIDKIFDQLLVQSSKLQIDLVGDLFSLSSEAQIKFKALVQKHTGRLKNISKYPAEEYDQRLGEYDYLIGAGRIAISGCAQRVPVFAIGEVDCLGWLDHKTYELALASNFGDIDYTKKHLNLDEKKILSELSDYINSSVKRDELELLAKRAQEDFDRNLICEKIYSMYQSAWLQKQIPKNIPMLMFHQVTDQELHTKHRIFVTKEQFAKQMQCLRDWGFESVSFKDLADWKNQKKSLSSFPKRPIVLTFDDGYQNNLTNALPILKQNNLKATIFLLTDNDVNTNFWDQGEVPESPLLSRAERQLLVSSGVFEIGSHGFRHEKLSLKNRDEALLELQNSKKLLEAEFGREIPVYAFTYGDTNLELAELSRRAGYAYAINTDRGGLHFEENPHSIFRVSIFPEDNYWSLWKKTSSWYRKYYFHKRGH